MTRGPRVWTNEPESFGRHQIIVWLPPSTRTDRRELAAARFQHDAACVVRDHLRHHRHDHHWLANKTDAKSETVRRKLTGEAAMTLTDLIDWALTLGIDVIPDYASGHELAPPIS